MRFTGKAAEFERGRSGLGGGQIIDSGAHSEGFGVGPVGRVEWERNRTASAVRFLTEFRRTTATAGPPPLAQISSGPDISGWVSRPVL